MKAGDGSRPPAVVRWLLRMLVPESEREFYLGDLAEGGRRSWWREVVGVAALRLGRGAGLRAGRGVASSGRGRPGARFRAGQIAADVRLGVRRLLRSPAATVTVLVALSVGIGLSAMMFSLIDGALLPTLPFEAGDRIVRVSRLEHETLSAEAFAHWTERQTTFEGLGAFVANPVNVAIEGDRSEPVEGVAMTAASLPLLSVRPVLGRLFTESEAAAGSPVVVIGHEVWRTRLAGDPGVLGRTIRLNGEPAEVIGVMPERFGFPWNQQLWTPLHLDPVRPDRNPRSLTVFGVLREGVSMHVAAEELAALDRERPRRVGDPDPVPMVVAGFTDLINPPGRSRMLAVVMLGVAFMVLLVACANAANVLLAQAAVRSREVAVRTALGASRTRIAVPFWIEVSMLAVAGALGGAVLAAVGVALVRNAMPTWLLPFWFEFRVNLRVLGFVAVAGVFAAMVAGVMPVVHASRGNAHDLLKDSSRGASSRRTGSVMGRLVAAEMAVSFVLLIAAGLFVRSAINVRRFDLPFDPDGVHMARVRLPDATYRDAAERARLIERLEDALGAVPGTTTAAAATAMPGLGSRRRVFAIDGVHAPVDPGLPETRHTAVSPRFFATFGASAVAGRAFDTRDDGTGLPVAVVNLAFEAEHFPDGAPGHRVAFPVEGGETEWLTIVGVVPDLLPSGLDRELESAIYTPIAQDPPAGFILAVRSSLAPAAMPASIRETIAGVDADVALYDVSTLEEAIEAGHSQWAWISALFLLAGALALFLAAIGLYGVMAFQVAQRTREIGVRMALGGGRRSIVAFVLRRGSRQIGLGLLAGTLLAAPVAWLLRGLLLEVAPFDPLVITAVTTVLVGAGWLGCFLPALRATRVDPQTALAAE